VVVLVLTSCCPYFEDGSDFSAKFLVISYEGNSKSKVSYFIPTERIPSLSW
jgi:hypothetical protein